MTPIRLINQGININEILWGLQSNPQLWDQHTQRTQGDTPFVGTRDIWARYSPKMEYDPNPHEAVWYEAAKLIPDLKTLAFMVMALVKGEELGAVLVTKIPPHTSIKPHQDHDWHAHKYDKFAISIAAHPKQAFHFENPSLITRPGDLWWFNNQETHWVTNDSDEARITVIVCVKIDKALRAQLERE
jgi:quercetin dioxygenase-like cupin family protein